MRPPGKPRRRAGNPCLPTKRRSLYIFLALTLAWAGFIFLTPVYQAGGVDDAATQWAATLARPRSNGAAGPPLFGGALRLPSRASGVHAGHQQALHLSSKAGRKGAVKAVHALPKVDSRWERTQRLASDASRALSHMLGIGAPFTPSRLSSSSPAAASPEKNPAERVAAALRRVRHVPSVLAAVLQAHQPVSWQRAGKQQQAPAPLQLPAADSRTAAAGPLEAFCDQHFGRAWLARWAASARTVCAPAATEQAAGATQITCRSMHDAHMPAATAPQVLCDASNLWLHPARAVPAFCPAHRPGYLCNKREYNRYRPGAFAAACAWPDFDARDFPADHLRDVFAALSTHPHDKPHPRGPDDLDASESVFRSGLLASAPASFPGAGARADPVPALLVTRDEHHNVFHTLTDLMNVYLSLVVMGWLGHRRQVIILDRHPPGPLDGLWAAVAAGGGAAAAAAPWPAYAAASAEGLQAGAAAAAAAGARPLVRRLSDLAAGGGGGQLLRQAVWVPPGYESLLFAHHSEDSSCPRASPLFQGFRRFLLEPFGLLGPAPKAAGPLRVVLVVRHRTRAARVVRRIANERALADELRGVAGTRLQVVDLGKLDVPAQLKLVSETDIYIGMHGAALAWAAALPPHAAVVELWPQTGGMWRCYEHLLHWMGLLYRRWENGDPHRVEHDPADGTDATHVDADAVALLVQQLAQEVLQRRLTAPPSDGSAPYTTL